MWLPSASSIWHDLAVQTPAKVRCSLRRPYRKITCGALSPRLFHFRFDRQLNRRNDGGVDRSYGQVLASWFCSSLAESHKNIDNALTKLKTGWALRCASQADSSRKALQLGIAFGKLAKFDETIPGWLICFLPKSAGRLVVLNAHRLLPRTSTVTEKAGSAEGSDTGIHV